MAVTDIRSLIKEVREQALLSTSFSPWAETVTYTPVDGADSSVVCKINRSQQTNNVEGTEDNKERFSILVSRDDVPSPSRGDQIVRDGERDSDSRPIVLTGEVEEWPDKWKLVGERTLRTIQGRGIQ